jgi:hypothetical protein
MIKLFLFCKQASSSTVRYGDTALEENEEEEEDEKEEVIDISHTQKSLLKHKIYLLSDGATIAASF